MKLSAAMETALVRIAEAMPRAGEKSLVALPCHGRTAQALEDRKLIHWKSAPDGALWFLTGAGWEEVVRLGLAAWGCTCSTPSWHNPTCPALPEIWRTEEAAAEAKAEAAEAEWAARNLAGKLRCQALKFEGHRCANVITCTVTTGEWMELTEWNLESVLESDTVTIEDVIKADGSAWDMGHPDSVLAAGDLIFINAVHRAWCGECAEEERKARDFASVLIIEPLADGDYIPTASRYCANGYGEDACDAFCGSDDHAYREPVAAVASPPASQLTTNIRAAVGLKF